MPAYLWQGEARACTATADLSKTLPTSPMSVCRRSRVDTGRKCLSFSSRLPSREMTATRKPAWVTTHTASGQTSPPGTTQHGGDPAASPWISSDSGQTARGLASEAHTEPRFVPRSYFSGRVQTWNTCAHNGRECLWACAKRIYSTLFLLYTCQAFRRNLSSNRPLKIWTDLTLSHSRVPWRDRWGGSAAGSAVNRVHPGTELLPLRRGHPCGKALPFSSSALTIPEPTVPAPPSTTTSRSDVADILAQGEADRPAQSETATECQAAAPSLQAGA